MICKPMLASGINNLDDLRYPLICTPKIDGVRCLKVGGEIVSRTLRLIPNVYVRETLQDIVPEGIDGELVSGNFNTTSSKIMTKKGKPEFHYCVFDLVENNYEHYVDRLIALKNWYNNECADKNTIQLVPTFIANDQAELLIFEETCVENGYEGIIMRSPESIYKFGRSTIKEQYLLKMKRFEDSEGIVIAVNELYNNQNEGMINRLGYVERSSSVEGKYPAGIMGSLYLKDVHTGIEVKIGSGFDYEQRKHIWENKESILGKIAKYKYQPSGAKVKPRFPIFIGFRDANDLTK